MPADEADAVRGLDPARTDPLNAPVLVARRGRGHWSARPGDAPRVLSPAQVAGAWHGRAPLVVHRPATARRLGLDPAHLNAFDLLELFAFINPAETPPPTARGLAAALDVEAPGTDAASEIACIRAIARRLIKVASIKLRLPEPAALLHDAAQAGWIWGAPLIAASGAVPPADSWGMRVWGRLPEWQEQPPEGRPTQLGVLPEEAVQRLERLTGAGAEPRPEQRRYAMHASLAFAARHEGEGPAVVLAEAGTGTGKTLGYIAPASLWAERNGGTVWISTYTKNLQKQIDDELDRLYPDLDEKTRRVVVRKGRENYLCLLNYQDAVRRSDALGPDRVGLALMARWVGATRDGALYGGDFPGWLAELIGRRATLDLTDHRGECIYSACEHYRRCFIERAQRRSRRARVVVANHALVMVQAAAGGDDPFGPDRFVFDEGHHLFDAADSAFAVDLSGREGEELRRWIAGREGQRRSRARGLRDRVGDLVAGRPAAEEALAEAMRAARALPAEGWRQRLDDGQPDGPFEVFLARARGAVLARSPAGADAPYGLEAPVAPPGPELIAAAADLEAALRLLEVPLGRLAETLAGLLDDEADTLEPGDRARIDATARAISRRAAGLVKSWREMLAVVEDGPPAHHVDWLAIDRAFGRDIDVALKRRWIDPMLPFARVFGERARGLLVTSATLTGGRLPQRPSAADADAAAAAGEPVPEAPSSREGLVNRDGLASRDGLDWQTAYTRAGARHIASTPQTLSLPSPFDYGQAALALVVTDLRRSSADQISAAYRELFLAAGGGALGLFTAVRRLRVVHDRIAGALDAAGISLYAQHVDPLDTATLVDIFRAEEESCLLGTDAVRDGVDVPGRSLRLLVLDRVPWPRPDILHRARRLAFGGHHHDDAIVRLRLRQAFGRLIRARDDHGVFVLLDGALPTRLTTAFPEGVRVERVGIAEAIRRTRGFLHPDHAGVAPDVGDGTPGAGSGPAGTGGGLPRPDASGNNRDPGGA
ncbi:ATP-dependent DNA helicase [Tistrella sp. BH-R2-4]|uniref:ATP-dependent DNA helicase n=1 Tax=Tistrella arctica TaxID=3133430 RepID=A0ABU9YMM7_9PROT